MKEIFVTGTDTDVGKTIVSAGLCMSLKADYWKPIQAGYPTDMEVLARYIPQKRIHPASYILKEPLSPNQASAKEDTRIQTANFIKPKAEILVIEGAGGLLVPYNDKEDMRDLIQYLGCPVLVVARSTLGTLNHSLLTIEALKARNLPILGIILVGPFRPLNKKDIELRTGVRVLLELPKLKDLSPQTVKAHFENLKIF